jgi:hypothetical protein
MQPGAGASTRAVRPARLPMTFEVNRGQAPRSVRFLAHGGGFAVGFGRGAVQLALSAPQRPTSHVRLTATGGTLGTPVADGRRAGRVSYLAGARSTWLTDLPTFPAVRYRAVWPGIDLAFRGTAGILEYDLHVAPHADPAAVDLALAGASVVRGDGHGGAVVRVRGGGVLRMAPPVSFQDGPTGRDAVASRLVADDGHVRVALGAYDHSRALVIDPSVAFSTFAGGRFSVATGVAADAADNVYVTGNAAQGDDLVTTAGSYKPTYAGSYYDAYVQKLNPSGTAVIYSTYLGGTSSDSAYGLAVDPSGNAYVTGTTGNAAGFPTTSGALQTGYGGGAADGFIAKLNPTGTDLVYSTLIGGSQQDGSYAIAVGTDGSAYFTGNFPGYGGCSTDGLATGRLDPAGSALSYYTCNPGAVGHGIAVDGTGAAYVGGLAQAAMTTTSGVVQATRQGEDQYANNSFAQKLSPTGSVVYRTFLGGGPSADDSANAIAVDSAGNAYITGVSTATLPTTVGAVQTTSPGGDDAFVTKLNASGSQLLYQTLLGGTGSDNGHGIAVDSAGHAYVTGAGTPSFPVTGDSAQAEFGGSFSDAFLTELAADGKSLVYSTFLGGPGQDIGYAAAMAPNGNVLFAGGAGGAFPVTNGAADMTAGTGSFVADIGAPVAGGPPTLTTTTGTDGTTTVVTTSSAPTAPGLVKTLTTSNGQTITLTTAPGQEGYAQLERHLLGGLSGDDMARLLANGGFSIQIPLTYPAYPGTYSASGSASPSGIPGYNGQGVGGGSPVGYDSAKKKVKRVVLFAFRKTYPKLGTYKVKIKLTKAGTKLLRAAVKAKKKLKVSMTVTVAAKGHKTVRHTSSVTLKVGKSAKKKP